MKKGKKVWWVLGGIGGFLILVYLVAMALFSSLERRLIFYPDHPTRKIVETPDEYGLSFEEVRFAAADGTQLFGWFIPADNPRGTLLFCHGNAGNISHRRESIKVFNGLRLNIFVFDYRGYGESSGSISEEGTYRDVEAAWDHIVSEKDIPGSEIIVFGRSLGGAIAAWVAQDRDAKALIIESAFTSIPDIGASLYPFLPVRRLARYRYATVEYLENVRCPVLVIYSIDDEMIPSEHARRLFDAAGEPKEMLQLRGTHNETIFESGYRYENGLNAFISNLSR
jgi:alpha-beta hydrolase superfamily lysophospholipase